MKHPLRGRFLPVALFTLAMATAAGAQNFDAKESRNPTPDPRDKFSDPVGASSPDRINGREGYSGAPLGSTPNAGGQGNGAAGSQSAPAFAASPQPVPGGYGTLEPMGEMDAYQPPVAGQTSMSSLPGMDLYDPNQSAANGSYDGHPAWWPQ